MIELPIIDRTDGRGAEAQSRVWRSYPQFEGHPESARAHAEELMAGASDPPSQGSRRQFLQIMGASMALAGLAACRRPEEPIVPYTRRPEEVIPGIPLYFATAMPFRGTVRGLLVESHEGRPTKIEGNPEHPGSLGATSLFEQASVLTLYDPDRSQVVLHERAEASWEDFAGLARDLIRRAGALRTVVMAEPTSSPTLLRLRDQLLERMPNLRWITYSPEGDDQSARALQSGAGSGRAVYDFGGTDVIVSLDADFLAPTDRNFIQNTRTFASGRRISSRDDRMTRLYVAESALTITGGMADHRMRLRSGEVPAFAAALAAQLGVSTSPGPEGRFANHPFIAAIVEDVRRSARGAVIVAGEGQPAAVHQLAAAMNAAIARGNGVHYLLTEQEPAAPQAEEFAAIASAARAGQLDLLVLLNVNPVYSAPAEFRFDEVVRQVPLSIHHGLYVDETAQLSTWHVPAAHYLEYWGDGRAYDGLASVIQPLIAPLYPDARSEIELVNLLASGVTRPGYDLVRETWQEGGEEAWRRALHDGFIVGTEYGTASAPTAQAPDAQPTSEAPDAQPTSEAPDAQPTSEAPDAQPAGEAEGAQPTSSDALELVFRLDPSVFDGTYSNNAWLQELPDPTTKIVWDNVAAMSRATAERLGVGVDYRAGKFYADIVEISASGHSVRLPVWIAPGHADNSITLALGYGRNLESSRPERRRIFFDTAVRSDIYARGPIANDVGGNVAPLRNGLFASVRADDVRVEPTGERMMVVTTQEHGSLEGRPLARMGTLQDFTQEPEFAARAVPTIGNVDRWSEYPTIWEEDHPARQAGTKLSGYYAHQWGMVIDLNTCTGCNACIVACNSENNIQMVGKDQVSRGREMQWLRVDRYYVTDDSEAEGVDRPEQVREAQEVDGVRMVMQPLPCQHCENAPCESVCPVSATVHSADGTNQMVYNRCIGTRYCSNNCPYKVRRFNFYNWSKTIPTQVQMAQNPNVTVRFRGVMEKCSFCIQRIREGNRREIVEGRPIEDGDVQTACQQVCPADAIIFGDLNDPGSRVSLVRQNPRRYEMLEELNTRPRTSYLARVWNPNPQIHSGS